MSVIQGEIVIAEANTDKDGWMKIEKNGKRGTVPTSYLKKLKIK